MPNTNEPKDGDFASYLEGFASRKNGIGLELNADRGSARPPERKPGRQTIQHVLAEGQEPTTEFLEVKPHNNTLAHPHAYLRQVPLRRNLLYRNRRPTSSPGLPLRGLSGLLWRAVPCCAPDPGGERGDNGHGQALRQGCR